VDWILLTWGLWPVAGSCEHGNEPSGLMKGEEFVDCLCDYQLLKKGCAPWGNPVSVKWSVLQNEATLASHNGWAICSVSTPRRWPFPVTVFGMSEVLAVSRDSQDGAWPCSLTDESKCLLRIPCVSVICGKTFKLRAHVIQFLFNEPSAFRFAFLFYGPLKMNSATDLNILPTTENISSIIFVCKKR
jgi:hypothetical protein